MRSNNAYQYRDFSVRPSLANPSASSSSSITSIDPRSLIASRVSSSSQTSSSTSSSRPHSRQKIKPDEPSSFGGDKPGPGFGPIRTQIKSVMQSFDPLPDNFHGLIVEYKMEGKTTVCRVQVLPGELLWVGVDVSPEDLEVGEIYKFEKISEEATSPGEDFPHPYRSLKEVDMIPPFNGFDWTHINTRTIHGVVEISSPVIIIPELDEQFHSKNNLNVPLPNESGNIKLGYSPWLGKVVIMEHPEKKLKPYQFYLIWVSIAGEDYAHLTDYYNVYWVVNKQNYRRRTNALFFDFLCWEKMADLYFFMEYALVVEKKDDYVKLFVSENHRLIEGYIVERQEEKYQVHLGSWVKAIGLKKLNGSFFALHITVHQFEPECFSDTSERHGDIYLELLTNYWTTTDNNIGFEINKVIHHAYNHRNINLQRELYPIIKYDHQKRRFILHKMESDCEDPKNKYYLPRSYAEYRDVMVEIQRAKRNSGL